jgi:hypothetical protein
MAVRVRQAHRIRIEDPVSVYDFSEELSLEVRFVDIPYGGNVSEKVAA